DIEKTLLPNFAPTPAECGGSGEAIQDVLDDHVARIADGREVIARVPTPDHPHIGDQSLDLGGGQRQRQLVRAARHEIRELSVGGGQGSGRCDQSSVRAEISVRPALRPRWCRLTCTSRSETAAGVIPGSRAAAPIVAWRCAVSAWRASNDKARMSSKARSIGIDVDSLFVERSTSACCLST